MGGLRARRLLAGPLAPSAAYETIRRNRAALANRNTRRLVFAELASLMGDFVVIAAMPFAVLSLGGSATEIGLVLAAQGVGVVAAMPLAGVIGDRVDRRVVMVVADLVRFVSQAAIAALLLLNAASVEALLLAQLVHGLAQGFFQPASSAIVPDVIGDEAVQPTFGLKTVARGVAGSIGPALGALAVAVVGPGLAIAADATTFLISAGALAGISGAIRSREEKSARGSFFYDFVKDFASLRNVAGCVRSRLSSSSSTLWSFAHCMSLAPRSRRTHWAG